MRSIHLCLLASMMFSPLLAAATKIERESLFAHVTEQARTLADRPYDPPDENALPEPLRNLDYQQYREIRFNKDHALWDEDSHFSIELFHLGFLYRQPVVLHEVVGDEVRTIPYTPGLFDYGGHGNLEQTLDADLGFAGFRIHYPINEPEYKDEVIAFLGASYFRMVGRGQSYGLSARGLAVDTASPKGEEFPRFTEFWLVRPADGDRTVTFYALLDSRSVTGSYRFHLQPGTDTVLDVEARLFARNDVGKLGVAPLTSMFMWGENSVRHFDDYRPEVHDSDGLLQHTSADEWIWRPLTNPGQLQISSLLDRAPEGFGLAQRDRAFDSYHDLQARYHRRPGLWVSPRGDWGKGMVQLVEIPSEDETNDNIVAFWVPDEPVRAGQQRTFRYRLHTFAQPPHGGRMAMVRHTRTGWGGIPGAPDRPPPSHRQFIVDFKGGELSELNGTQPVKPELSVVRGEVRDLTVRRLPEDDSWRVAFNLSPQDPDQTVDMRLFLSLHGRRISETWNYVWSPELSR